MNRCDRRNRRLMRTRCDSMVMWLVMRPACGPRTTKDVATTCAGGI